MFDTIGVNPDAEAGRRRAGALLLTLGVTAAVLGSITAISAYYAANRLVAPEPQPFVEVALVEEPAPTPLEAPPPPAISRGERPDPTDTPQPASTVPSEPTTLAKPPPDHVAVASGDPNGKEDGRPDGAIDGKGLQTASSYCATCAPGGTGDGTIHVFHQSELELKRRVDPDFPAEAQAMGLSDARCVATVRMDDKGAPYDVDVSGCPDAFRAPTREALLKWRWYPPKIGKQATRAQTAVVVTYKLR